jgi:hypothetical protein
VELQHIVSDDSTGSESCFLRGQAYSRTVLLSPVVGVVFGDFHVTFDAHLSRDLLPCHAAGLKAQALQPSTVQHLHVSTTHAIHRAHFEPAPSQMYRVTSQCNFTQAPEWLQ